MHVGRCLSVSLSVCLSVCVCVPCLTLSRVWKGIASWKLAEDAGWPHLEVEKSKVKGQGRLTPWSKISHNFRAGRPRNLKLGIRMEWPASPTCAVTSNWKLWVAVQVTTCKGWGILWRPHYRPHSFYISAIVHRRVYYIGLLHAWMNCRNIFQNFYI